MSPRRLINFVRSPAGALLFFLVGFVILIVLVNSRRSASDDDRTTPTPAKNGSARQQIAQSVERGLTPFRPPTTVETPRITTPVSTNVPPQRTELPPLSLLAETPVAPTLEKEISASFAPFGRLIPCELVITVDSSAINTPIVGLVTEDVFHHGQLIVPAGTEVHGRAQVDRARERIASDGHWTLVWQTGQELSVSGLALNREHDDAFESWAVTDGSAGLRGKLLKSDQLAELKLYAAALLSGAADVFTDKKTSAFGSFASPSLTNAPLKGAQSVMDRYAQQILTSIERDGFYVRVPAGKQFYLYVTQTLDQTDARIGGAAASATPPSGAKTTTNSYQH